MKLWTRLMVVGLALAFAFSLCANPAAAASKKKKKKEAEKKAEKREERREERRETPSVKGPIEGANLAGKPGYFFSDTAKTLDKGQVMGAAHFTFDSGGSSIQIPVGVSFGITDKITVNANTSFFAAGGVSGIYYLNFGGKYGFKHVAKGLDIAAGLDFGVGPLSNQIYGGSTFAFDPYGVCTYTFSDGLQLNGKLGLYVSTYTFTYPFPILGVTSYSVSYSQFQLDLGAAYPFDRNLTGIAELATNGVVGNGAVGGTPLLVGIRTGKDVQFQALGGLDLGGQVGLFVGGGVVLVSK